MKRKPEIVFRKEMTHPRDGKHPGFGHRVSRDGDMLIERDVAVTMRDGIKIYADVLRPAGDAKVPAIVTFSPYGKHGFKDLSVFPGTHGVPPDAFSKYTIWEGPDPLYWVPPGGESIAQVAENRVRNFLYTLHRELDGRRVLAVTHGEFIWATRLVLERFDDDEYERLVTDDAERIGNCEIVHYSRRDPTSELTSDRLEWIRRSRPVDDGAGGWRIEVGDWRRIEYRLSLGDTLADD